MKSKVLGVEVVGSLPSSSESLFLDESYIRLTIGYLTGFLSLIEDSLDIVTEIGSRLLSSPSKESKERIVIF